MYLNEVRLLGHLTRDPELRHLTTGTPVAQFGLALNRKWRDDRGELKEEVIFLDIEAWGKQAETLAKYTAKGDPIYVGGRLRLDQWTDKTSGEKRSRLKVVLEQFQFLNKAQPVTTASAAGSAPAPTTTITTLKPSNLDADVPF